MAVGIRIRHRTLRSCVALVPVLAKPYTTGPIDCPTCKVLHPVKTVHLWLDDTGTVLVSEGVLAELRMAGMPELEVLGQVGKPPPLRLGGPVLPAGGQRFKADFENRKIRRWGGLRKG